jgi:hypothetical protein
LNHGGTYAKRDVGNVGLTSDGTVGVSKHNRAVGNNRNVAHHGSWQAIQLLAKIASGVVTQSRNPTSTKGSYMYNDALIH